MRILWALQNAPVMVSMGRMSTMGTRTYNFCPRGRQQERCVLVWEDADVMARQVELPESNFGDVIKPGNLL
jgi:hypothetical protein